MLILLIQISVVLFLIYLYLVWNFKYWKERSVPSAKAYPILGSFPKSFIQSLNICYEQNALYKEYRGKSPYVGVFSGRTPQLLILDNSLAKDILVKNFKNFHDNEVSAFTNKEADPIFSRSPFMLLGEEWKEKRAEIAPAFTNNRVKAMYPMIDETCKKLTQFVHEEIKKQDPNGLDVKELAAKFTTEVVAGCIYGIDSKEFTDGKSTIRKMSSIIFEPNLKLIIYFLLAQAFPIIRKVYTMPIVPKRVESFFVQLMSDVIKLREEQNIERDDYLNYLLEIRKKKDLQYIDMVANAITFFLDGFETSSIVIAHNLYYLAANKSESVQNRLRKEINASVGADGRIDVDVLSEMEYLDQVFHETLRMSPPAGVSTKVWTIPTELTDYKDKTLSIEKGMVVQIPIYCIHHDPGHYPDPEAFNPDRFSPENGGLKSYKDKGVFLGFSDGPRICLGMRFAMTQSKSAIVELIRNFEITVNPKTKEPLQLDPKTFFLLPIGGLCINFKAL